MTRRGAFDAALVIAVGVGWGLLAPATKALFLASPAAFDGITVAVARAVWAFPVFLIAAVVLALRERPQFTLPQVLAIVAAGVAFGIGITGVFSVAAAHT